MIKIEIEAANGADARQQMFDLLGIEATIKLDTVTYSVEKGTEKDVVIKDFAEGEISKPAEEQPKTRKRRTQVEIQKDALADTEEPSASTENVTEEETAAVPEEQAITAEMLTQKAVELGRAGKRDAVLSTLENQFGGATIAKKDGKPQLQLEQYQAVMDAFNAIA